MPSKKKTGKKKRKIKTKVVVVEALMRPEDISAKMMYLARNDDAAGLEELLKKGENPNQRDGVDTTALHYAAKVGASKAVTTLIEYRADVNAVDQNNETPLAMACKGGHTDVVKLLVVMQGTEVEVASNKEKRTALHNAAEGGYAEIVDLLLGAGADVHALDTFENNALHYALEFEHVGCVRALLAAGATIIKDTKVDKVLLKACQEQDFACAQWLLRNNGNGNVEDEHGTRPLHLAAKANNTETVDLLLDVGAEVYAQDVNQQTCLHLCAREGHANLMNIIFNHPNRAFETTRAKVNLEDKDGRIALHVAAAHGHTECCKVLMATGMVAVRTGDPKGLTALHLAAQEGHKETLSFLLTCDVDVNARNDSGYTPLHLAVPSNHEECVKLLIRAGADFVMPNPEGKTPLQLAAACKATEIIYLLIECGSTVNQPLTSMVLAQDKEKRAAERAARKAKKEQEARDSSDDEEGTGAMENEPEEVKTAQEWMEEAEELHDELDEKEDEIERLQEEVEQTREMFQKEMEAYSKGMETAVKDRDELIRQLRARVTRLEEENQKHVDRINASVDAANAQAGVSSTGGDGETTSQTPRRKRPGQDKAEMHDELESLKSQNELLSKQLDAKEEKQENGGGTKGGGADESKACAIQ